MNLSEINEAIYASSNGAIVERRKNIIMPILVLLAGAAMLVANCFIENGSDTNNLKSTLMLAGGCVLMLGVILSGIAIFGEGRPYHTLDKNYLTLKQYSFDRSQQRVVEKAVNSGDRKSLDTIEEGEVAGIIAVCYYSPKGKFVAMQAFAYEEFTYKPITELKIVV
jgi:hypothetical protein